MIKLLFILNILLITFAAKKCDPYISSKCNYHTQLYMQYIAGNLTYDLIQKNTFLPSNPCDTSFGYIRPKYIKRLKDVNVTCYGAWCVNKEFSCKNAKDRCYEANHIIDITNSEYELKNYSKNIIGNMVMIYKLWNKQLSQRSWKIVEEEKRKVYGDYIFDKAYYNVEKCNITNPKIITDYVLFTIGMLGIILCIIIIYNVKRTTKPTEQKYDIYKDIQEIVIGSDEDVI